MPKRDAEGRPVATRNAGAFLAPRSGVIPVPSSLLDHEGNRSEPAIDVRLRSRLRFVALVTSLAVWSLLSAAFRLILAASETAAEVRLVVVGDEMTRLMHSSAAWNLTNLALVGVGLWVAMRLLPRRTREDWLWVGAGSLAVGFLLMAGISVVGGPSAALLALIGAAWLLLLVIARRVA